jgi:hypothetical protein
VNGRKYKRKEKLGKQRVDRVVAMEYNKIVSID